jgi:hypothetical protein
MSCINSFLSTFKMLTVPWITGLDGLNNKSDAYKTLILSTIAKNRDKIKDHLKKGGGASDFGGG